MFDYRMKALQKALGGDDSVIDIKEAGGASFSFLDKETEQDHHDYIELLSQFFERMMTGDIEVTRVIETFSTLLTIFKEEDEEVSEVCAHLGRLEDLKTAWNRQTQVVLRELPRAAGLYRDGKVDELPDCFDQIENVLKERMPYYSQYQIAFSRYAATLPEEELAEAADDDYDQE